MPSSSWSLMIAVIVVSLHGVPPVEGQTQSEPRLLSVVWEYPTPRELPQAVIEYSQKRPFLYVALKNGGLEVLDIRNPRQIKQLGWWNPWRADSLDNVWFNSPGHTNQIEWHPDKKQVWMSAGDSELQVVDVSQPAHPRLVAKYGEPKDKLGAWGVKLSKNRAYLTYINATIPFQGTWSGIKTLE